MSYEGYIQAICANGHLNEYSRYCAPTCVDCKAKLVWSNSVDQTNNPCDGVIPDDEFAKFELTPERVQTCPTCGNAVHVTPATYRVPTVEEAAAARYDGRYVNDELVYGRWQGPYDRPVWVPRKVG